METEREVLNYAPLHAFAEQHRVSYNELCAAVRAALAFAPAVEHPLMAPEALCKTIGELLGAAMDQAVKNGANSVSMPDEYVALAAWLCETPPQPSQPAPQAGAAGRVYTYRDQPGNVEAWRLGEACRKASLTPGGDPIDQGLALLRDLQDKGFGVVTIAAARAAQAQGEEGKA